MTRDAPEAWLATDLLGGDVALDLANTAGGATKARDVDRLGRFGDALAWAEVAGCLSAAEAGDLRARAAADPEGAADALRDLKTLRDAVHRVFSAIAAGAEPPPPERRRLAERCATALSDAQVRNVDGGPRLEVGGGGLSMIHDRVALAAGRLLLGDRLAAIRECARCSWLFVDRTGRRTWCSKRLCGNREKAARHHRRRKAEAARLS